MDDFITWLNKEIDNRNWSYNELARRAGMSGASVSLVMTEQQNPTYKWCSKIARALVLPPSLVMQKAGLLELPNHNPTFRELMALVEKMPIEEQREVLAYAIFRQSRHGERGEADNTAETAPVTS